LTVHDNWVDLWVYPGPAEGRPCLVFPQPGSGLLPLDNRSVTRKGGAPRAERPLGSADLRITGGLAPGAAPAHLALSLGEPARLFGQLLRRALERRGIQVRGAVRVVHAEDRAGLPLDTARMSELAHLESPPLAQWVRATLKPSNNLYGHLLLLQAGARRPGRTPGPASAADGLAALRAFLPTLGIPPGDVLLEDGAGLSRKDLVKPSALVRLLAAMDRRAEGPAFRAALPVAGMDGTLATRMTSGPAFGQVQAKTGTLRQTSTLAGYLDRPDGKRVAFAILLNNATEPGGAGEVDALAGLLASEFLDFSLSRVGEPR
jgi:D-alanyl-D-alanine carboxypeptidase/D-alanyl-D-alanine-endopeptidase (penicillin-binding protein 4)